MNETFQQYNDRFDAVVEIVDGLSGKWMKPLTCVPAPFMMALPFIKDYLKDEFVPISNLGINVDYKECLKRAGEHENHPLEGLKLLAAGLHDVMVSILPKSTEGMTYHQFNGFVSIYRSTVFVASISVMEAVADVRQKADKLVTLQEHERVLFDDVFMKYYALTRLVNNF